MSWVAIFLIVLKVIYRDKYNGKNNIKNSPHKKLPLLTNINKSLDNE